jgi:hypothetical protein
VIDRRYMIGWATVIFGVAVVLMALGVLPMDRQSLHAPGWVYATGGAAFALAGAAVLCRGASRCRSALGGLIAMALALVSAWITLAYNAELPHGGIPFLSPEANLLAVRLVFGAGTLAAAVLGIVGLLRAMGRR